MIPSYAPGGEYRIMVRTMGHVYKENTMLELHSPLEEDVKVYSGDYDFDNEEISSMTWREVLDFVQERARFEDAEDANQPKKAPERCTDDEYETVPYQYKARLFAHDRAFGCINFGFHIDK